MIYFVIKQGLCPCCNYFDPDTGDKREATGLLKLDDDEWKIAEENNLELNGLAFVTRKNDISDYQLEFVDGIGRSFFSRRLRTKFRVSQSGKNSEFLFLEEVTEAQYETYEAFGIEEFYTVEKLDLSLELIIDYS